MKLYSVFPSHYTGWLVHIPMGRLIILKKQLRITHNVYLIHQQRHIERFICVCVKTWYSFYIVIQYWQWLCASYCWYRSPNLGIDNPRFDHGTYGYQYGPTFKKLLVVNGISCWDSLHFAPFPYDVTVSFNMASCGPRKCLGSFLDLHKTFWCRLYNWNNISRKMEDPGNTIPTQHPENRNLMV